MQPTTGLLHECKTDIDGEGCATTHTAAHAVTHAVTHGHTHGHTHTHTHTLTQQSVRVVRSVGHNCAEQLQPFVLTHNNACVYKAEPHHRRNVGHIELAFQCDAPPLDVSQCAGPAMPGNPRPLRCGHGRVPATGTGPRAAPATATLAVLGQTSYDSTRWGAPWQYSTPSMKSASRTWLAGIL